MNRNRAVVSALSTPRQRDLPPRIRFGAVLIAVFAADIFFCVLLSRALGSTPGAGPCDPVHSTPVHHALRVQLWRWVNHLPFGARGAWGQVLAMWRHGRGRKAAKAVRVAPERTGDQERRLSQLRAAVIAAEPPKRSTS